MTTVARLEYRLSEAKRTGVLKEEIIRSNLHIFEDDTYTKVLVAYKQNVFSPAESRDIGKTCMRLYDSAPFVSRSSKKQVGLKISKPCLRVESLKTHFEKMAECRTGRMRMEVGMG